MKRTFWLAGCVLIVSWNAILAAPPGLRETRPGIFKSMAPAEFDYQTYIDANRLLMFATNVGSFANDVTAMFGRSDGLYFPKGTDLTLMYAAGLWLGAKVGGDLRVSVAEYSNTYVPGPMVGGTFLPDNPTFKVYKIVKQLKESGFYDGPRPVSDPQQEELWDDYRNWPAAQGAPTDGGGKPKFIGDQTLWCVFNDADPSVHTNNAGTPLGLGVEVQQTSFAFDRRDVLGNCVFQRYLLINKGGGELDSVYVGLWADPDVGGPSDDYAGCDTVLNLGYAYNADEQDDTYGANPPAVGFSLLGGPMIPAGQDSAMFLGERRYGFHNLPMTAFTKYINGTDPTSAEESYRYMQGVDRNGSPMVNPWNGQTTTFMLSGDPVTHTGWVDYSFGIVQHVNIEILEVAGPGGVPVVPPDNVANSWNSTNEWYVTSDHGDDFNRLNWQGLIGTDTWEFRFTVGGSEYYNFDTDQKFPNKVPFEVWNLGLEKPNDPGNDRRIQITILDDDGSDDWTPGDRIYLNERSYHEPLPDIMEYTYPDDLHIGRIKFNENVPQQGTKVRFISHGVSNPDTLWGQDCRYMLASGPFHMAPGDTQEVIMAIIVGQGAELLSSKRIPALSAVQKLKETAALIPAMLTPDFEVCLCLATGDLNDNGLAFEIMDVVFLVTYLFRGGAAPPSDADCPLVNRADFNCDGKTNLVDLVRTVNYVYRHPSLGPCDPCRR